MEEKIEIIRSAWDDEKSESIYSESERLLLLENDELTPIEEAFMKGWENVLD